MKQQYFFLILLATILSCTNHNLDTIEDTSISFSQDTSSFISDEEAKDIICNIGYDTTQFEDKTDYYLVESTYRFYKKDLHSINIEVTLNIQV